MSSETDEPRTRQNPFSPMAVAKVTGFGDSTWKELTIETESVRRAAAYLGGYLSTAHTGGGTPSGDVIAIVGDYGTGKTHLAMELVSQAERALGDPTQAMYLDTTADSFITLYRRFMDKLGLAGVRARVSEYYARTVVESLEDEDLSAQIVSLFQAGDLTPRDAVERLGLMESALLRQVQTTLRRVTDNQSFGIALTLLLRTGFDTAVWDWLTGGSPAQVLVERGITGSIDTEVAALESMGVVALLYGRQQARFVLVIDELERIFAGRRDLDAGIDAGFQKLLEVFINAGAYLVLSGLPEFYDMLDASAKQRVSHVIEMQGLTAAEVGQFIRRAQQAKFGRDEITPFTDDTVGYLRNLVDGNARKVIRLCYEVYVIVDDERHRTGTRDLPVTDEMVREALRRQSGPLLSSEDIHGVVRRILQRCGWSFLQRHLLGTDEGSRADFWLTFPDRVGGCAVLITGSIIEAAEAAEAAGRIAAVRAAAREAVVVLVVNGMLAADHARTVASGLAAAPLVHAERDFAESFRALVTSASDQLRPVASEGVPAGVQQRLEQINRLQADVAASLRDVTVRLDDAQAMSDRRLIAIEQGLRAVGGGWLTEPLQVDPATLPVEVNQHFLDAFDALAELTQIDVMLADVFDRPDREELVEAAQNRLSQEDVLAATGVTFLLRAAVVAFRAAVVDWHRGHSRQAERPPEAASTTLDTICQRYDDVTEFLPVHKMWPLIRLSPWQGHISTAHRQRRYERVQQTLAELSPRVRRSLEHAFRVAED